MVKAEGHSAEERTAEAVERLVEIFEMVYANQLSRLGVLKQRGVVDDDYIKQQPKKAR